MNLYRVKLKGMISIVTGVAYGYPYVVANNPTDALKKVQVFLNENDLGFSKDRVMESIELLAEEGKYPSCGIQLYL